MQILLADDDESIRDVLGMILRAQGHAVGEAVDGVDALTRMRKGPRPGLVILDMMMPLLDGEGVIDAMRSDPALATIPVVVLSGHQSAREHARQLGAAGCLVKPVELRDLLATVDNIEHAHQPRGS